MKITMYVGLHLPIKQSKKRTSKNKREKQTNRFLFKEIHIYFCTLGKIAGQKKEERHMKDINKLKYLSGIFKTELIDVPQYNQKDCYAFHEVNIFDTFHIHKSETFYKLFCNRIIVHT